MARLHTFHRGSFTLWADRVPVMHGRANLFTLWRKDSDGRHRRLIGGVTIDKLRAQLGALAS